jgi:excisionase family DNA binding protein
MKLLLPREVAEILRCRPRKVYELFHDKKLRGVRLGKSGTGIRILEESVHEFINSQVGSSSVLSQTRLHLQPPH